MAQPKQTFDIDIQLKTLGGTGNQMVVVDNDGNVNKQNIPTGADLDTFIAKPQPEIVNLLYTPHATVLIQNDTKLFVAGWSSQLGIFDVNDLSTNTVVTAPGSVSTCCYDSVNDKVYYIASNLICSLDPNTMVSTLVCSTVPCGGAPAMCFGNGCLYIITWSNPARIYTVDCATGTIVPIPGGSDSTSYYFSEAVSGNYYVTINGTTANFSFNTDVATMQSTFRASDPALSNILIYGVSPPNGGGSSIVKIVLVGVPVGTSTISVTNIDMVDSLGAATTINTAPITPQIYIDWINGNCGHNIIISKNNNELYCTAAYSNVYNDNLNPEYVDSIMGSQFAKIIISTMTLTDVALYTKICTDDMGYQYLDANGGYCYCGGENNNIGSRIDTKTMTVDNFFCPMTFCVATDGTNLYALEGAYSESKNALYLYKNFDINNPEIYPFPKLAQINRLGFGGITPQTGSVFLSLGYVGYVELDYSDTLMSFQDKIRAIDSSAGALEVNGSFADDFTVTYYGSEGNHNAISVSSNSLALRKDGTYDGSFTPPNSGDFPINIISANSFQIDLTALALNPIWDTNFFARIDDGMGNHYDLDYSSLGIKFTKIDSTYQSVITITGPCDFLSSPTSVNIGVAIAVQAINITSSIDRLGDIDTEPNELAFTSNGRIFYTTWGGYPFKVGELQLVKATPQDAPYTLKNGNQSDNIATRMFNFLNGRVLRSTGMQNILSGEEIINGGNNVLILGKKIKNFFSNIANFFNTIFINNTGIMYYTNQQFEGQSEPRYPLDIRHNDVLKHVAIPTATAVENTSITTSPYLSGDIITYWIVQYADNFATVGRVYSDRYQTGGKNSDLKITIVTNGSGVDLSLVQVSNWTFDEFMPDGFRIVRNVSSIGYSYSDYKDVPGGTQTITDDGVTGWIQGIAVLTPTLSTDNIANATANIQGKLGVNIEPSSVVVKSHLNGSLATKTRQIGDSCIAAPDDHLLEVVNGGITVTLDSCSTYIDRHIIIKNVSSGSVSVITSGTDTFDGGSTLMTIPYGGCLYVISDGVGLWMVISSQDVYFYSINIEASGSDNTHWKLPEITHLASDKMFVINFLNTDFKAGIGTTGTDCIIRPNNTCMPTTQYYQAPGVGQVTFVSCKNSGGWRIQSEVFDKFDRLHVEDNYYNIMDFHWRQDSLSAGTINWGQVPSESAVILSTDGSGSGLLRLNFGDINVLNLVNNRPIFDVIFKLGQVDNKTTFRLGFTDMSHGSENNSVCLSYNPSDTGWYLECTNGGTLDQQPTGIYATSDRVRVTLCWVKEFSDTNGRIELYINGNIAGGETNPLYIPVSASLQPFIEITELEAVSKNVHVYYSDVSWLNYGVSLA